MAFGMSTGIKRLVSLQWKEEAIGGEKMNTILTMAVIVAIDSV